MIKVYVGITTTTNRCMYLEQLIDNLKKISYITDIVLFIDDGSYGLIPNKKRCFTHTLEKAKNNNGYALLLEDDIELCKNFGKRLIDVINNSSNSIISLFTRQRHIPKRAKNGLAEGVFKRGFYEQAVLWKNDFELYDKCWSYYESNLKYTMPKARQNHHDVILQDFLVENNIEWTISCPTLVEHIGKISTMKHQVGKSILFIDNINSEII